MSTNSSWSIFLTSFEGSDSVWWVAVVVGHTDIGKGVASSVVSIVVIIVGVLSAEMVGSVDRAVAGGSTPRPAIHE